LNPETIMTTNTKPLTWNELARLEPRLSGLLDKAKAVKAKGRNFCANDVWYRRFKPRLLWLVGWDRPDNHPVLSSMQAFDLAYETIYEVLPNCRQCTCL
jgi:hypothetical protein